MQRSENDVRRDLNNVIKKMDEIARRYNEQFGRSNSKYMTDSEYIRLQSQKEKLERELYPYTHQVGISSKPQSVSEARQQVREAEKYYLKFRKGSLGRTLYKITGQGKKIEKIADKLRKKKITQEQAIQQYVELAESFKR